MTDSVPTAVYVLWWIGLIVTLVVFVPLAVYVLHRAWRAAHSIEWYAAEALTAAAGIAGNTKYVPALDDTIGVASQMLAGAGGIVNKLDTAATVLAERAE